MSDGHVGGLNPAVAALLLVAIVGVLSAIVAVTVLALAHGLGSLKILAAATVLTVGITALLRWFR